MKKHPNVAVVGCGYWGKNLVRNFKELAALMMVCDLSRANRLRARKIAQDAEIVHTFEDVLSSNVRGVVLATPAETHYHLTKRALQAGKDVFVEKPLAIHYDEGVELVEMAEGSNRILMVGHVLEYHPAVSALISLIENRVLGKVKYIYSNRLSLGIIRREENILWSFAPHDIAIILRIMGELPCQVVACGGNYVQPNIADVTVTNLLFDNGVRAHAHVSWLHPFKEQRLVVIGSRKMASFDDVSKKLVLYDQRVDIEHQEPIRFQGESDVISFAQEEPLAIECAAFLDAMETRRQPLTDGRSGLAVLQVLQLAQRSLMLNGQPQSFPIKTGFEARCLTRITRQKLEGNSIVKESIIKRPGNGKPPEAVTATLDPA